MDVGFVFFSFFLSFKGVLRFGLIGATKQPKTHHGTDLACSATREVFIGARLMQVQD